MEILNYMEDVKYYKNSKDNLDFILVENAIKTLGLTPIDIPKDVVLNRLDLFVKAESKDFQFDIALYKSSPISSSIKFKILSIKSKTTGEESKIDDVYSDIWMYKNHFCSESAIFQYKQKKVYLKDSIFEMVSKGIYGLSELLNKKGIVNELKVDDYNTVVKLVVYNGDKSSEELKVVYDKAFTNDVVILFKNQNVFELEIDSMKFTTESLNFISNFIIDYVNRDLHFESVYASDFIESIALDFPKNNVSFYTVYLDFVLGNKYIINKKVRTKFLNGVFGKIESKHSELELDIYLYPNCKVAVDIKYLGTSFEEKFNTLFEAKIYIDNVLESL